MPKKIGDLVDRPSLLDKLSRQTVAQKMGTTDATELDPAAPQTLPHDPRHWRCVLEWPYGRGEGQEQIRTIYLRSRPQDVVGKRSAGLLESGANRSRLPFVCRIKTSPARQSISWS